MTITRRSTTPRHFSTACLRNVTGAADQSRGRFRSFLLTACRNFLIDGYRREKRKEPVRVISINGDDAERLYRIEPVDEMTPSASSTGNGL